jgi:hypothetical protein
LSFLWLFYGKRQLTDDGYIATQPKKEITGDTFPFEQSLFHSLCLYITYILKELVSKNLICKQKLIRAE